MPDSQQPPLWGSAYQPADLDALLSGDQGSIPEALRPVKRTLDALRVAPAPGDRELAHEAAARAAFRALMQPPLPVPPLTERVLAPSAGRPPGPARHRHRRHPAWGTRRPVVALTGAAVAAVVVVAVAVTGGLPGSLGRTGSGSGTPRAGSSATGSGNSGGALEGKGTRGTIAPTSPSSSPVISVSSAPLVSPSATSGTGTLCREFFEPTARQSWAAQQTLFGELAKAAGSRDMMRVFGYCFHYLSSTWSGAQHPHPGVSPGGHPGGPGFGGNPGGVNKGSVNKGSGNTGGGDFGGGNSGARNSATPGPSTGDAGHLSGGAKASTSDATGAVRPRQPDAKPQ